MYMLLDLPWESTKRSFINNIKICFLAEKFGFDTYPLILTLRTLQ